MDFFKFISASDATTLDQGSQINGLDRSTWVERYAEPGEFTFESKLSAGVREFLPEGTLISQVSSMDIMMVEDHDITEKEDEDSTVVTTGRSLLADLENRIIGVNQARAGSSIVPYTVSAGYLSAQIVGIINDHIGNVTNTNDNLTDVVAHTSIAAGTNIARTVDFGTVLERVLELLKVDDLGIKTIRKNTFGLGVSGKTDFEIHVGVDRSNDVFFSWQSGDISDMEYLFTNRGLKNSALVKGRYVWQMVDLGPTKYNRRMMLVDGSDIDGNLDTIPTGGTLTSILTAMTTRGNQALMAQNGITIVQADIADTAKYQYRRDYNVGDLISIGGNFGEIQVMRVTEYAEIEDENGQSGHPTLSL